MGQVQLAHPQPGAAGEYLSGCKRIGKDIELRGCGDVATARAATHDRYSGNPLDQSGVLTQRQRNVGERPDRHHPASRRDSCLLEQVTDGIRAGHRPSRGRQAGPAEPRIAMDMRRMHRLTDQRPLGASVDGHVQTEQLENLQRIVRDLLERRIAGDRGHALELRHIRGEQQRDGVIVTWITVDEEFGSTRRRHFCDGLSFGLSPEPLVYCILAAPARG